MPKLSHEERIEAEIIAQHMLCSRVRDCDVKKALREKFSLSYMQSGAIVKKVRDEMTAAAMATREEIRKEAYATLDEAIAVAFKRQDVRAVVHCVKLQSEIGGLIGSEVQLVTQPKPDNWLKGKPEIDVNAQAVWGKDFGQLSSKERSVLVEVLRQQGDDSLADEVQSQAN